MPDEARPPVAIRSLRPYATEEAFLAEERDTLTRTAITLIGAPSRPRGVVIRFELTLESGTPLVRGEGRVLGFQAADDRGPSALTLRFTKLDTKSKALVDRAAELRDSDKARPADGFTPQAAHDGADAEARGTTETLPPGAFDPEATTVGSVLAASTPSPSSPPDDTIALSISSGSLPPGEVEVIGGPLSSAPPPSMSGSVRDDLLGRLRLRATNLSPLQVESILSTRRADRTAS